MADDALDAASGAGERSAMILSPQARALWDAACALSPGSRADVGANGTRVSPGLPPLWFLTDPERTPEPWRTAERLPAGAGVILRHFGRPEARDTALRLREATTSAGVLFLIAADPELVAAVGADGLHLPHGWLETPPAIPPGWRLSAACRSREALARAEAVGVEVVFVSPVFFPGGRSGARPGMTPLGREGLAALVRSTRLPVIALGGLDAARILTLRGSGARGAAAVEAVQVAFGDQAVRP